LDAAIQDSQGRIADRTRELLGPTDIGVVQFRRLMLEAARAVIEGKQPLAVDNPASYRVRAGGIVANANDEFPAVMTARFGTLNGAIAAGSGT
jgi:hypothetical protein